MGTNKEIWLAGGCFWGTEHYLSLLDGVVKTDVGYANGRTKNPTYRQVCSEDTGFAEAVHVVYDPAVLPLEKLLDYYFLSIDPTAVNRQGGDVGTQYRTGIYYTDAADEPLIAEKLKTQQKQRDKRLAVEVKPLENYYLAENDHQAYLDKNPGGYCHIPGVLFQLARDSKTYRRPTEEELQKKLSPLQYQVTQRQATEAPYKNEYDREFRPGIYVDIATGEPLFVSSDKFDSGCGWPAFSKPIDKSRIACQPDNALGMQRVEVKSRLGNSHLGHVFNDGPKKDGGLRYCINSAALRFVPREEMEAAGYGAYLGLVK